MQERIGRAAEILRKSRRTAVITGAGMSIGAGIPAFKTDPDGVWTRYNAYSEATVMVFESDPEGFWRGVQDVARLFLDAAPSRAHRAVAFLPGVIPVAGIITSNLDGLHREADAKALIAELHGTIRKCVCPDCDREYVVGESRKTGYISIVYNCPDGDVPRCECGSVVKPAITLIGEPTPHAEMVKASKIIKGCEAAIVIGTSGFFSSAGGWAKQAHRQGAKLIEINPERTSLSDVSVHLQGAVDDLLTALYQELR